MILVYKDNVTFDIIMQDKSERATPCRQIETDI